MAERVAGVPHLNISQRLILTAEGRQHILKAIQLAKVSDPQKSCEYPEIANFILTSNIDLPISLEPVPTLIGWRETLWDRGEGWSPYFPSEEYALKAVKLAQAEKDPSGLIKKALKRVGELKKPDLFDHHIPRYFPHSTRVYALIGKARVLAGGDSEAAFVEAFADAPLNPLKLYAGQIFNFGLVVQAMAESGVEVTPAFSKTLDQADKLILNHQLKELDPDEYAMTIGSVSRALKKVVGVACDFGYFKDAEQVIERIRTVSQESMQLGHLSESLAYLGVAMVKKGLSWAEIEDLQGIIRGENTVVKQALESFGRR